jgi:hypothetical protein
METAVTMGRKEVDCGGGIYIEFVSQREKESVRERERERWRGVCFVDVCTR